MPLRSPQLTVGWLAGTQSFTEAYISDRYAVRSESIFSYRVSFDRRFLGRYYSKDILFDEHMAASLKIWAPSLQDSSCHDTLGSVWDWPKPSDTHAWRPQEAQGAGDPRRSSPQRLWRSIRLSMSLRSDIFDQVPLQLVERNVFLRSFLSFRPNGAGERLLEIVRSCVRLPMQFG